MANFGHADMPVFYDADVFGSLCARRRPGEDDLPFVGVVGAVDEVALEGYAVTAEHSLRYPTAEIDLDEADVVVVGCDRDVTTGAAIISGGQVQGGVEFRVRTEPRRINDGAETAALLSSIPE